MKRIAGLLLTLMILSQGLTGGLRIDEFQSGEKQANLELNPTGYESTVNVTMPAKGHVLNATMSVSRTESGPDLSAYPRNVAVSLDENTLWAFNGTGYGELGSQTGLSNGSKSASFSFGEGGGSANTSVRLPKDAVVQSASLELMCRGPELCRTLIWNMTDNYTYYQYDNEAEDFNGDGFDDFLIGTNKNDSGIWYYFAAIYFGGSIINTTPDIFLDCSTWHINASGNISNDTIYSVVYHWASVGDINGDNFDDIASYVAEVNYSSGNNYTVSYFIAIFYGGADMDHEVDELLNVSALSTGGGKIAGIGDINGDGYNDILLSNASGPGDPGSLPQIRGYDFIFFGGDNMDNISDVNISSQETSSAFGVGKGAGDVNGDGYDDVIIGEWYNEEGPGSGRAYIYYGGKKMDASYDIVLKGHGRGDQLGIWVSSAGDVNGDGYSDVIVGARNGTDKTGRASIFFGGSKMDDVPDVNIYGEIIGGVLGFIVDCLGDINGDGYDDIGVSSLNDPYKNWTSVKIYFGGDKMDNITDIVIYNQTPDEGNRTFLYLPLKCGDTNGDNIQELLFYEYVSPVQYNASNYTYWIELSIYSWLPNMKDPRTSISNITLWNTSGDFAGRKRIADISNELNDYLLECQASGNDSYGNYYVDIPINITVSSAGNITLSKLNITYSYNASIPDFSGQLNSYLSAYGWQKDDQGNLNVTFKITSESTGNVTLSNLQIIVDCAPYMSKTIPDLEMNEDTSNETFLDLYDYFQDDYDANSSLNFSVFWASNSSIVNLTIEKGHYLSVDALNGSANDNWTGIVGLTIRCSDRWNQWGPFPFGG